jgi:hypothetical protein
MIPPVRRQSVHRAIEHGRVPTYAADGTPLRPGDRSQLRLVKPESSNGSAFCNPFNLRVEQIPSVMNPTMA